MARMPGRVSYRLSSQFILRMAGFPIERLHALRSDALADAIDADAPDRVAALYGPEIERLRRVLHDWAAEDSFRDALLLSAPDLEARVLAHGAPLPPRNSDRRHHEHSLVLYAQRLTTKNDTISAYGPSAWGRVDPAHPAPAVLLLDEPPIAARTTAIERWVCEALVARLAEAGIVVDLQVSAAPFEQLRRELRAHPEWSARLDAIEAGRAALERATQPSDRRQALVRSSQALEACGIARRRDSRALYAARLPVSEDCRRAARTLVLGGPFVEQATADLAPWYELWRDLAGLYASRIGETLRPIRDSLGAGPVTLAAFFDACREARADLWKHGGTGMAPEIYDQVQEAWQAQLGPRMDQREVALTADDLSFLRRRFAFERMRAFDNPAPDLQIVASSADAIAAGDWQLLVGEIHPDLSVWEHCFLLWCPDVETLAREYRERGHAPALLYGPTDELGVHILCRAHEWGDWTLVRPLSAPGVAAAAATDLLVQGDLSVRHRDGRQAGSLLDSWRVSANTHRFELLGTGEHAPRLRVGRAIVQRESWRLRPDDTLRRSVDQVGPEALIALRRLRAQRGWPEEVFVRPELPLRLTYYKDGKPICVDFRNPLLLEVFAGWVRKYLRLRVSEMLPRSSQCWLADSQGHYACELRMVAMPEPHE
jgi:hypothetical protein